MGGNRGFWIGLMTAVILLPQLPSVAPAQGIIGDRVPTDPVAYSYERCEVKIYARVCDHVV